jgi:uncharacterized protein (TIGR03067 family)
MATKQALLLSVMLLSSAGRSDAAPPKDLDRLQGDWTMVSGRVNGDDSVVKPDGMHCAVRGNKVSFLHADKVVEEVTIKLDPAKNPKAIDATLASKQVAPARCVTRLPAKAGRAILPPRRGRGTSCRCGSGPRPG